MRAMYQFMRTPVRWATFPAFVLSCALAATTGLAQIVRVDAPLKLGSHATCPAEFITLPQSLKTAWRSDAKPRFGADFVELTSADELHLLGNARVTQATRGVFGSGLRYQKNSSRVIAGETQVYTANGDEIRAQNIDINIATGRGVGRGVRIRVADDYRNAERNPSVRARAIAQRGEFQPKIQVLHQVKFSTCAENNQDVRLEADEITLDRIAGIGIGRSLWVKFKRVPIFYFPFVTFPIDDARKTGFLFPEVGFDNESGLTLAAPYYLNLAPNYDATLTPRWLSRRGAQLSSEFRYLNARGDGILRGEILPADRRYAKRDRYVLEYQQRHDFSPHWRGNLRLQQVSDPDYLRDFSRELDAISSSLLPSRARLAYTGKTTRFTAQTLQYEVIQNDAQRPYELLPQLDLQITPQPWRAIRARLDAQYSHFLHSDLTKTEGGRLRLKPSLSARIGRDYAYLEPQVALQSIRYELKRQNAMPMPELDAAIPLYSVDARVFLERRVAYGGTEYLQSLEPRLFYVKVPYRAQTAFPNFDTSHGSETSFDDFFRANRFLGGDRVGDTEQVAVSLASRTSDWRSGQQRWQLRLGQVFYQQPRLVTATATEADATNQPNNSGLFAEFSASVGEKWGVRGFARQDPNHANLKTLRLGAEFKRDPRRKATLAYTYTRGDTEQLNLTFKTSLGAAWQLQGNGAYSFTQQRFQSSGIAISYDDCCWAIRAAGQRYLDGNGDYKQRFSLTLELNDLGRIGARF